jgi:hypothetical protein
MSEGMKAGEYKIGKVLEERKKFKWALWLIRRTYGGWTYSSNHLDLCTRWRWVGRFTPRSLYSREKSPRHQLDRRLDDFQSGSGCCRIKKIFFPRRGSNQLVVLAIPTEISKRLEIRGSCPNRGTVLAFVWKHWRKSRKISAKITGVPTGIRAEYFPKYKSEALPINQHARWRIPWRNIFLFVDNI